MDANVERPKHPMHALTTFELRDYQQQLIAGLPALTARLGNVSMIDALIETGDLAAAESACAEALARCRDVGDAFALPQLLMLMVDLDVRAGRFQDAAAHVREMLQITVRAGDVWNAGNGLWSSAWLCAATGRYAEAATLWAAYAAYCRQQGIAGQTPGEARREQEVLSKVRQALGPGRARAADERGAAMSLDTAAQYALMLTVPAPPPARPRARGRESSAPGNGNWSPWSPGAAPTPTSPRSCTSPSAPSARTWTGSVTRPAAAAAPT